MEWGTQIVGPAAFLALSLGLVLSLLRMRREEITDMQARIGRLEDDNRRCNIIQGRLVNVLYENGLKVPEGTFTVEERE